MPSEKAKRITAHGIKLRDAIESRRNHWLTRKDLASLIGKKRLTPYDIDMLALLAENAQIRVKQEDGYSREGYRWVYGIFDENIPTD